MLWNNQGNSFGFLQLYLIRILNTKPARVSVLLIYLVRISNIYGRTPDTRTAGVLI